MEVWKETSWPNKNPPSTVTGARSYVGVCFGVPCSNKNNNLGSLLNPYRVRITSCVCCFASQLRWHRGLAAGDQETLLACGWGLFFTWVFVLHAVGGPPNPRRLDVRVKEWS